MIIFPAVDIQDGKAVRLKQGRAHESTVFSPDPVAAAVAWRDKGARWLHVVDLDGAFDGLPKSRDIVRNICRELDIPVQLGGGIRDEQTARAYLEAGVQRLIIGTMALEQPKVFASLCKTFPGQIGVSLDAEGGRLKTKGWVADAGLSVDDVLPRLQEDGAAFIIYTDIERDGMQCGVNLTALRHLAETSTVPVIAAGGVATLADVQALYPLSTQANLQGAISGRALYEGTLDLDRCPAVVFRIPQTAKGRRYHLLPFFMSLLSPMQMGCPALAGFFFCHPRSCPLARLCRPSDCLLCMQRYLFPPISTGYVFVLHGLSGLLCCTRQVERTRITSFLPLHPHPGPLSGPPAPNLPHLYF